MSPVRARRPRRSIARLAAVLLLAVGAAAPAPAAAAGAAGTMWTRCPDALGSTYVGVRGAGCAAVAPVASAVVTALPGGERAALEQNGWTALRAAPAGSRAHDLVALRGKAALRVRLPGAAPDLDGWAAGRELVFSSRTIVGGRPIPRDAAFCTSAFLVRGRDRTLGGLTAAHCAGLRRDGGVKRRNAALRRAPQPGIVLGRVRQILTRREPLDALLLPIARGDGRTVGAVVDRGVRRPPLPVVGVGRPLAGRRICFGGRTSGVDRCGIIRGAAARPLERFFALQGLVVRCTTIRARPGDSGGPVYTAPGRSGAVRAVGIVTLISGPRARMCFTPVGPVLSRLGARLQTAG